MDVVQSFFGRFPVRKISKDEVILQQGETPRQAYAVKQGILKVYNLTMNGEEKSISFGFRGELFPICWLFGKTKQAIFYYQAHTNCELYVIDKASFEAYLEKEPDFVRELLSKQVSWYVNSTLQINALEQTKAHAKLLGMFRNLCLRYGKDIESDLVKIQVPLTQQEVANFTGLTRETTAGELKKLRQQRVVFIERKYYTVDTNKLNALLDDEYNPGISMSATD